MEFAMNAIGANVLHKVSELEGALLDAAVAKAEGDALPDFWRDPEDGTCWVRPGREEWTPSISWDQGGPIIERERIELQNHACSEGWWAGIRQSPSQNKAGGVVAIGPTPLIAAMRAYVASKLGNEVVL
jgi:hypothetical protein